MRDVACNMDFDFEMVSAQGSPEEMAALERDWNAFDTGEVLRRCDAEALMAGKTFTLRVYDLWKVDTAITYFVCIEGQKTRYAVHSDWAQEKYKADEHDEDFYGNRVYCLLYYIVKVPEELKYEIMCATMEGRQERRAIIGCELAEQYVQRLVLEAGWDREWRAVWDPRKEHVRRALFAFFKGQVMDVRKQVYRLFRAWWLEDFTKPC